MLSIRAAVDRTYFQNAVLAVSLSLVAGAVNASGLLAAGAMTSHMTGNVTRVGEGLASGTWGWLAPARLILAFLLGAFAASVGMNVLRRWVREPVPGLLLIEAAMLALVAIAGLHSARPVGVTEALCLAMGWQNALITRISGAVIRTTHVTGNTTDLGIELGNVLFGRDPTSPRGGLRPDTNLARAGVHFTSLICFLGGATAGPVLFLRFGYVALLAPAALLAAVVATDAILRRVKRAPAARAVG